jgi:colanic acid/amylovoran biosynthesis protein
MRIVLHTGTLDCANLGDLAMLQVAVARLQELGASRIGVLTADPARLRRSCPEVEPVDIAPLQRWAEERFFLGTLHRALPGGMSRKVIASKQWLTRRAPRAVAAAMDWKSGIAGEAARFLYLLEKTDLVAACGQGTLADATGWESRALLLLMDLAMSRRKRTAMFGQGIGPLQNVELRRRTRAVLSSVDCIALRERLYGLPLLKELGVQASRIRITGDDAVEMAYGLRRVEREETIGVNMRISRGSGLDKSVVDVLRPVLLGFAREQRGSLVPVPIALHRGGTNDVESLAELLPASASETAAGEFTPESMIRRVGACRMLVTGAYHAALFALAQGIPVVCFSNARYAADKFAGLADLWGEGCDLLLTTESDFPGRLRVSMDRLWTAAPRLREPLLRRSAEQVEWGREAYRSICSRPLARVVRAQ